ncbi:hypothetical protein [Amycolatopsis nigrescens]|uniref:hypothetical protein n=1 Tax=Amycolatopsis nigrescens TaxID=381445 RepID=UPI0003A21D55|nr:hypothetical protein [Amycolatopsis nigrescens]
MKRVLAVAACGLLLSPAIAEAGVPVPTAFEVVESPALPGGTDLSGVATLGEDQAWTVGRAETGTLIEHWDQKAWSVADAPLARRVTLNGVAAVSTTDLWAVGTDPGVYPNPNFGTVLHSDGGPWSLVPTGEPLSGVEFQAVTTAGADELWAVGIRVNGPNANPVVLHRAGDTWTTTDLPNAAGTTIGRFTSVAATGADDVWATGWTSRSGGNIPLLAHWDGTSWTSLDITGLPGRIDKGIAVAALPDGRVWLAGQHNETNSVVRPVVQLWDGHRWTVLPDLPADSVTTSVTGLAVDREGRAWLSGGYGDTPVFTHWDGIQWNPVAAPGRGYPRAIATTPSGATTWAVMLSAGAPVILRSTR